MGYKLGYHILVLPNQVLLINSVHTNEVLLYVSTVSENEWFSGSLGTPCEKIALYDFLLK